MNGVCYVLCAMCDVYVPCVSVLCVVFVFARVREREYESVCVCV